MRCDDARVLVSAEVDGELAASDTERLAEHLTTCDSCAAWATRARRLRRATLIRPVTEEVDLTATVLARANVPRVGRYGGLRSLLVALGLVLLALDAPLLLTGDQTGASEHVGRHLGASGVALGIGFLYAAWRPERAVGLVPLAAALGVGLTISATVDLADGGALTDDARHLLELTGLVCLWAISGGPGRLAGRLRPARRPPGTLTPVG
jgi:predicted anti-sigma-YlaC factor YlaD